jgi:predicted phosphodiesterase
MSRIIFSGDTHGDNDIDKIRRFGWEEDDVLIQLGDFGGIWYGKRNDWEQKIFDFYSSLGITIFFVPGNHENFDRLFSDEFPFVSERHIDKPVKQIDKCVYMLDDDIYTINDKVFATYYGGTSIDKAYRIPHRSWWSQELHSDHKFRDVYRKYNGKKVNYFISHAGSLRLKEKLKFNHHSYESDKAEMEIEKLLSVMRYDFHLCGHYHEDCYFEDIKTYILYNNLLIEKELS